MKIPLLVITRSTRILCRFKHDRLYEHIRSRQLFSRKVLPLGIRSDYEAKAVVDSLVPHERRFIYEQLRRRMIEQYTESSERVTQVTVANEDLVSLWYVYFVQSFTVGFISTATLIFAGEGIDRTIGQLIGLSILGSAALGNALSNVSYTLLPRYLESIIGFFGIKRPILSIDQWQCRGTGFIVNLAKVIGVICGSICGMFPLMLMDTPHRYDIEHEEQIAAEYWNEEGIEKRDDVSDDVTSDVSSTVEDAPRFHHKVKGISA